MVITDIASRAILLVGVASLGGCATAYQSKSFTGGFSETDLSPTSFKIRFAGNGFTSAERVSDFAMLRAADKSLEDGCNYFGLVNEADGGSVSTVTVANAGYGRHGAWGSAFTAPIFKPNSVLMIKCFVDQPAGSDLFDAHFIAHSIRAKYKMPDMVVVQPANPMHAPTPPPPPLPGEASPPVYAPPPVRFEAPFVPVKAAPSPNIAQQVLAAQRIAAAQGCGDVSANPDATYQASCPAGTVIIECDGLTCRPVRMKSD